MRVLEHPQHNFGHCFQSYAAPASAFSSRNEPLHEQDRCWPLPPAFAPAICFAAVLALGATGKIYVNLFRHAEHFQVDRPIRLTEALRVSNRPEIFG
jgi:hypothetical protein